MDNGYYQVNQMNNQNMPRKKGKGLIIAIIVTVVLLLLCCCPLSCLGMGYLSFFSEMQSVTGTKLPLDEVMDEEILNDWSTNGDYVSIAKPIFTLMGFDMECYEKNGTVLGIVNFQNEDNATLEDLKDSLENPKLYEADNGTLWYRSVDDDGEYFYSCTDEIVCMVIFMPLGDGESISDDEKDDILCAFYHNYGLE